ncbi:unnamed protein product (macronuclear) [Paramecium tetraurelia]|uniref:Uncharacterized protein n=2 Tax=Paramecium TaxID=5884 RepID=A0D957_PARTE|nr:uncharacterized protein GSPATT00014520001 [Paramecium tetraurelia]CAD8176815.1 unnamed protein product [Paramecium octaurelia]CAK79574.1 unnamed protein product [Paramecium tetraurelia]|eukprot:XP_001446971.1 hypothetical protein (macronuclear) [Paramecium tetraurelia strain d4-2]
MNQTTENIDLELEKLRTFSKRVLKELRIKSSYEEEQMNCNNLKIDLDEFQQCCKNLIDLTQDLKLHIRVNQLTKNQRVDRSGEYEKLQLSIKQLNQ